MNQRNPRVETRKLALTAVLAAIYTIARAIPISKLIGISGTITAAGIVAPLLGVLLEPPYGVAAVFIGTMIASFVPWNPLKFYGLDFLPGALNVALVSLLIRGRRMEAVFMFIILIGLFIINPFTETFVGTGLLSPPIPYLWLHLVAFAVIVSPLSKNLAGGLTSRNYRRLGGIVLVLAFTGTMIEHLAGGILFATIVGRGALALWPLIFIAYPFERAFIVAIAVPLCATLLSILRWNVQERPLTPFRTVVTPGTVKSSESGRKD